MGDWKSLGVLGFLGFGGERVGVTWPGGGRGYMG